jgi:hypothetical protein
MHLEAKEMDEKLNAAVEVLLRKLEEQTRSVLETKKMINSLRQMMGEEPLFGDSELQATSNGDTLVRPDQYYGKPLSTAVRDYLERRKTACTAEDILKGIAQGAFDFDALGWEPKTRVRSLAITLAKNTAVFHRLPNGTFGLLSWYPEVAKRKAEHEKGQELKVEPIFIEGTDKGASGQEK